MKYQIILKHILCKKNTINKFLFINKKKEYIYLIIPKIIKVDLIKSNKLIISLNKNSSCINNHSTNLLNFFKKKIIEINYGLLYYFNAKIQLKGVGFKFLNNYKKKIILSLRYSHLIILKIPQFINIFYKNNMNIILIASDKQKLYEFCYYIQKFKKPTKFNKKGIFIIK